MYDYHTFVVSSLPRKWLIWV